MSTSTVPVIDISPFLHGTPEDRVRVAEEVAAACTDTGFLVISGHDVDPALIDRMYSVSRTFFERPLEEKMQVGRPEPGMIRGYSGIESESFGLLEGEPAPPDLREIYDIGPLDVPTDDPYYTAEAAGGHFAPNPFPTEPQGFEDTYRRYYEAMEGLTLEIFEIIADGARPSD